jgi:hypothetical protein
VPPTSRGVPRAANTGHMPPNRRTPVV